MRFEREKKTRGNWSELQEQERKKTKTNEKLTPFYILSVSVVFLSSDVSFTVHARRLLFGRRLLLLGAVRKLHVAHSEFWGPGSHTSVPGPDGRSTTVIISRVSLHSCMVNGEQGFLRTALKSAPRVCASVLPPPETYCFGEKNFPRICWQTSERERKRKVSLPALLRE